MDEPNVKDLLVKGFLPDNLPPVYHAGEVWETFENKPEQYQVSRDVTGFPSTYSGSKRGNQRRIFSISHPAFQFDAAVFFVRNWAAIKAKYVRSPGSLSVPRFSTGGARAARITPHSELPGKRLNALARFRYCLVTDVSRCFPSIYTHSIPWALNGRAAAKADRRSTSAAIYGNRLDFILRQSQDGQTIGIGVGSDISRMTAEIILSAADEVLLSKYGTKNKPTYLRHVDDYWVGANSYDEAEKHLANVRSALGEFQLDLNEHKTRVLPVYKVLGDAWPHWIERTLERAFGQLWIDPELDPVAALSEVFDRSVAENDDGMLRHAIRIIDENHWWSRQWGVLEKFLAQCAVQFSHTFDYVARVIAWRSRVGDSLDRQMWKGVVEKLIVHFSSLGRDSEALWALWLMKELNLTINKGVTDAVVKNNSPLVLGYLAHLFQNGRTRDPQLGVALWGRVGDDPFSGEAWPLTLELMHLGIARPGGLPASRGDVLDEIFAQQRSLINYNARPKVFVDDDGNQLDRPQSAIEDFTSDYDDEDEDDGEDEDPDWNPFDGI